MATSVIMRPATRNLIKSFTGNDVSLTFLLPSFSRSQALTFSTSARKALPRDNNRNRGVSTVRRTGPRQPLSVSKEPLPKPVLDPKKRSKVLVDPDHGLWEFFHSKDKPMNTPEEDYEHGRPWSVEELRHKSWEDLHALWWVCCKERNRIATETFERERLEAGYGAFEQKGRDITVRRSQRAIKQVLTERYYSWDEARRIAANDPEVDLSGTGVPYTPSALEEDEDGFQDIDYDIEEEAKRASERVGLGAGASQAMSVYESAPEPRVPPS